MKVEQELGVLEGATEARNVLLLSTEKKVYGFDLMETFRVAIGRHDSNDLQFNSRNVSNYHAEIVVEAEGLVVHDLGSTNGTYVNEERVRRRRVVHGDRIRVGSYEVTVRFTNAEGAKPSVPEKSAMAPSGEFRRARGEGATLKELLLGCCREGQSMRLVLTRGPRDEIFVYICDGKVVHVESARARAEKALFRAFEWRTGRYRIEDFPANDVPRLMGLPVETLVEDGEQQAEEMDGIISKLPPPDAPLRLRESCKMRICDFTPIEIDAFQSLIRTGTLAGALEDLPMTDLKVMSLVHALLRKRVFEVEENTSLLEQTNIITRS